MPIYDYQGQQYDIEDTDPTKAKEKILKYLGTQQVAQQQVDLPKPEGFVEPAERSFVQNALKISGGLSNVLGIPGADSDTYRKAVERSADVKKGGPWYSPEVLGSLAGSLGVQVPATLAAIPAVAATAPAALGGLSTAALTGLVGSAVTAPGEYWGGEQEALMNGATPEQAKNMGRNAAAWTVAGNMLPGQGNVLGRIVKGAAQGMGAQVGESYTHNLLAGDNEALKRDPLEANSLILSGITGGALGAATGSKQHERWLSKSEPDGIAKAAQQRLETGSGSKMSDTELNLLDNTHRILSQRRLDMQEEVEVFQKLMEDGAGTPEIEAHLKGLEGELRSAESTLDKLDKIFADPNQMTPAQRTDHQARMDQRKNELIQQIKARKAAMAEQHRLSAEESNQRFKTMEEENTQIESSLGLSETNPKTPPPVIAADNIGRAMSDPRQAPILLQNVLKKQAELEARAGELPGSEFSSLKTSLEVEAQAYRDIIAGKQPDLSWFDGAPRTNVEGPRIDEQVPTDTQVPASKSQPRTEADMDLLSREISDALEPKPAGPERFSDVPNEPLEGAPRYEPRDNTDISFQDSPNPFKDYFETVREIQSLEKGLAKISQQLSDYEAGLLPSGTIEAGLLSERRVKMEQKQAILEKRVENLLKTNARLRDWLKKNDKNNQRLIKAEQDLVVEHKKYGSLDEILSALPHNLIDTFLDNKQLFRQTPDTKLFFDKNLSPELQAMFAHYVNKLGLQHDQFFVVLDNALSTGKAYGNVELFGNTGLIRIDPKRIKEHAAEKSADPTSIFGKMSHLGNKILTDYLNVRIAAHELGHFLLVKYLNDMTMRPRPDVDFKLTPVAQKFINNYEKWLQTKNSKMYQPEQRLFFDEFFAEAVGRELLFKHTLDAFGANAGVKAIQSMLSLTRSILEKTHSKVSIDNFVTRLTNELITQNADAIKNTGKTIWQQHEQLNRDKAVFQGRTLEDTTFDLHQIVPEWYQNVTRPSEMSNPDIVPETNWSTKAAIDVVKKSFGKTQLVQIFKDNPYIQKAYWLIRDGESMAAKSANHQWHGDESFTSWDSKSVFTKFNKVKDGSSPYFQLQNTTDKEAFNVLQVLQKGFDSEFEYSKTLETYGQHLTPNEVKTFNALTKMWGEQYQNTVKLQEGLNKKHILPYRPGWFPSVRTGEWYVNIGYDGHTAYRQQFDTKVAAEHFINKLKNSEFRHLDVSPVQKKGVGDSPSEQKDFLASAIEQMIQDKYPTAKAGIQEDIDKLKLLMNRRGGKLGMHHEQRAGILGFKGSEIDLGDLDQGHSFKEAVIKSVDDFSSGLKTMYTKTKVGEMLLDPEIDANSRSIIQQMYDSALNRNDTKIVSEFDTAVREGVERSVKFLFDITPGLEYHGGKSALDSIVNHSLEALYLYKVMAKASFVLGQFMTPIQAIRHMSYDSGFIQPYVSMGKGLWNLTTGNKDLKRALYQTRNESHTFEPAFIDALHLTEQASKPIEFIKDWVMLRKPAEFADTMSRVFTFSGMYEHYKSLGKSHDDAVRLAQQGTDATMIQYNKQESAAIFQHAGMLGQQVRPLQTFPTAALGNLVADIKHMSLKDFKSFAPFVNYALTTIALGGVLSLQFVQEYEMIRKWMEDKEPGSGPPAVTDLLIQDPTLLERVEVDPTAVQQALLLGIPATVSGVDLASSLRANEALATVVVGVLTGHKKFVEALPLANLATDMVGGASTLAYGKVNDISVAERAKAMDKLGPSGHLGYGLKDLAGVNETKVFGDNTGMMIGGKEGNATQERTTTDKVAGYLGTKSTDTRTNLLLNMRTTELDKRRIENIKKFSNLFVETGNPIYLQKLTDLDVTDKQLENTVTNTVYKKIVDQRTRDIANKQGRVNPIKAERSLQYGTFE